MTVKMIFYHRKEHIRNVIEAMTSSVFGDSIFVITSEKNSATVTQLLEDYKNKEKHLDDYSITKSWNDEVKFIITDNEGDLYKKMFKVKMDYESDGSISNNLELDVSHATQNEMMEVSKLSAMTEAKIYVSKNGKLTEIPPFPRLLLLEEDEATVLNYGYFGNEQHKFTRLSLVGRSVANGSKAHKVIDKLKEKECLDSRKVKQYGSKEIEYTVKDDALLMGLIRLRMVDCLSRCNIHLKKSEIDEDHQIE